MKMPAVSGASRTPAQQRAIEYFDGDVCVPAGAGSGKTAVLVERYLHAVVKKGFKPSEILAITYTDKAAAEMRHRLIEETRKPGLEGLRTDLESAPIGTIHSFCIRLLRENPIECGIDPEFRILGDAERELLQARVFDALMESESGELAAIDVLAQLGEEQVRKAFAQLHAQRRALGVSRLFTEPDFGAVEKNIRIKIDGFLSSLLSARCAKKEWTDTETQTRESAAQARAALAGAPSWERFEAVRSALKKMHAGSAVLKSDVQGAKALGEEWESAEGARLTAGFRKTFLRLFEGYERRLEDEKKRLAAYDFDDFIAKTLEALQGEDPVRRAFAARTRTRFRAVFVDEYQDVNPAQAALVELLKNPGNRFVVGDRRQAIYGFRHADPEIFERVRAVSAVVSLSENFRSRKPVLDFINAFFAARFDGDEPLAAALPYGPKEAPSVEILAVTIGKGEGEKPLDRARVAEAKALAARLAALVHSKFRIEPKNGAPRPVEWGDIAVLFRKSTAIRLYDRAFREAGIPFDLPKSKGYFEKPEVTDLVSFLSILDDPHEDIPLAAVLRSPLAGLSDDALFLIARTRMEGKAFFEALTGAAPFSDSDRDRLRVFMELFTRLRAARERLGVSRILETVLDQTDYRAQITASAGPQAAANVEKLIDLARETEAAGGGVADFVRLTRVLAEREDDEPEAKMPADRGNAVSFLTVHSAKGLEFPVVAVADLGAQPIKDSPFFRLSSVGDLGLKFYLPDGTKKGLPDPIYRTLKAEADTRAFRESERLLYVAMTRAREHLILSGAWKAAKRSGGGEDEEGDEEQEKEKDWMRMVFETCGFDSPRAPGAEQWNSVAVEWINPDAPVPVPPLSAPVPPMTRPPARPLPVKSYEMTEDVTVTRLVEAASREEIEALIAEEPDKEAAGRAEEEDEPLVPANRFGTVFHKLMELSMRPSILGPLPRAEFEDWTREFTSAEKENLDRQMRGFWKGEWGVAARGALKRYPELPFIYKMKHGLLKGQLDLVYQDPKAGWTILDYKTNRVTEATVTDTARRYELQLALYALVFSELTGQAPARGVLYFSALERGVVVEYKQGFEKQVRLRLEKAHQEILGLPERR